MTQDLTHHLHLENNEKKIVTSIVIVFSFSLFSCFVTKKKKKNRTVAPFDLFQCCFCFLCELT